MEPSPTAMENKTQQVVVFWPLVNWLLGAGLVALGLWLGPWKQVVASVWLYPVIIGGFFLVVSEVLVLGRESMWLVFPFGLHWKRIRRKDIVAVIDFYPRLGETRDYSGGLAVRTADDGLYWFDNTATARQKRRLAELLCELYGVKIAPQPLPPYHGKWD